MLNKGRTRSTVTAGCSHVAGAIGLARLIAKQGEAPSQGMHVIFHVLFIVQTAFLRNTMDHEPRQAYGWHSD